jgi:ComF family protein
MGWGTDLLLFLFPVNCLVCGRRLSARDGVLCISCEFNIPCTGSGKPDHPASHLFWGRVSIQEATCLFRFEKGSRYQVLFHELKYRKNRKVGTFLGRMLGKSMYGTCFTECDLIIPVPLHPRRLRERGYNQSEIIARGVSEMTGIPLNADVLQKKRSDASQTSKGRYDRYLNVAGSFQLCRNPPDLNGLALLLVDDVVTTGATLEACCQVLESSYQCKIYAAAVSCA